MRALILSVVAACGCCGGAKPGGGPPAAHGTMGGPRNALADDAAAIDAFRKAWRVSVVPNVSPKEREMTAAIDGAMQRDPDKLVAKLASCRESAAIVRRTNADTHYDFVLFGTLADLDRDGDCWDVMYQGGMKLEVAGYLDPVSGKLLLVWRIPEG